MTIKHNETDHEPQQSSSPTEHLLTELQLHGYPQTAIRRTATKPARQRFTRNGREHDGSLAISRKCAVHHCAPGRIGAADGQSACRTSAGSWTSAEQIDRRPVRGANLMSPALPCMARNLVIPYPGG
jgi:hypothetical protein